MSESIKSRVIRKFISQLVNMTPNVIYYSSGWIIRLNGTLKKISSEKENPSSLSTAAVAMACAMNDTLRRAGDEAEIKLTGVTSGKKLLGDFVVIVRRVE